MKSASKSKVRKYSMALVHVLTAVFVVGMLCSMVSPLGPASVSAQGDGKDTGLPGGQISVADDQNPVSSEGLISRDMLSEGSTALAGEPEAWLADRLVYSSAETQQKPSIATDSNGYLWVAYEDWSPANNHYGIRVSRSMDKGNTWMWVFGYFPSTVNLSNPSIAIDPYDNMVYVAFEYLDPSTGYDIKCMKYRDSTLFAVTDVDTDGRNDRFPSITCEYQWGAANYQYISYEMVWTNDDRDLMFARSVDHGATWATKTIAGENPNTDDVYTGASITNAENYIYIACQHSEDYTPIANESEIWVYVSSDFGLNWTLRKVIDNTLYPASNPSIAATHGGDVVVVAWQSAYPTDDDIRYCYSINKGSTWSNAGNLGYLLPYTNADERWPALTVDGGGSTSDSVYGYIHAAFWLEGDIRYTRASYLTPSIWETPLLVNEANSASIWKPTITTQNICDSYSPGIAWTDARNLSTMSADIYYDSLGGTMSRAPSAWSPTVTCGQTATQMVSVSATGGSLEGVTVSRVSGPAWLTVSPSSLGCISWGTSKTFTMTAAPPAATTGSFLYTVRVSRIWGAAPSTLDITGTITVTCPTPPSLISPTANAVLDNKCPTSSTDQKIWDFDWSDVPGATQYHLYVIHSGAALPVIDDSSILGSSYHWVDSGYVSDANLQGWTWKVRAYIGGVWGDWSETRFFQVEPASADCPCNLGEAVDNTFLGWTTGGYAPWFCVTNPSYYGGDSAHSGTITHSQYTSLQTLVTGPGTLSFYWKVSSEANHDYLRFYIDGVHQAAISGSVDWQQRSYSLATGTHTLEWTYTKDGIINSGSDCGWVDKVEFLCGAMVVSPTTWSTTVQCAQTATRIVTVSATGGPVNGVSVSRTSGPSWLTVSPASLGDISAGSSKTFTIAAAPPAGTSGSFTYTVAVSCTCGSPSPIYVTGTITVQCGEWSVPITASTTMVISPEAGNPNLEFGTRAGATDGFDTDIDVPHPPPGPSATFDAHFAITDPLFTELDKDYRAPLLAPSDLRVWTLRVWSTSGVPGEGIEVTWDASQIPDNLNAYMNTGTQTIDMKGQSFLLLPGGDYTLIITVSAGVCVDISLKPGWNMVSVPVIPPDNSVGAVFPGVAAVSTWNPVTASYVTPTIVEQGKGYWVAVVGDTTLHICGAPLSTWAASIKAGWDMIGSVINNASIADPNDNPNGSVQAFAYWWNPVGAEYTMTTVIEPGKGYWIASVQDCTLTLP